MLEIELQDICSCATEGMREPWLPLQSPGLAGGAGGLGGGGRPGGAPDAAVGAMGVPSGPTPRTPAAAGLP